MLRSTVLGTLITTQIPQSAMKRSTRSETRLKCCIHVLLVRCLFPSWEVAPPTSLFMLFPHVRIVGTTWSPKKSWFAFYHYERLNNTVTPDSSIWVIRQSKGSIQWRYNTWLSNQPGIYVHLPCFIVKSATCVPKFYQIFQVVVPTSTTALSGSCRLCFSADPFWMSDLNCFLSCVYRSRSGWKTSFRRIFFFFH